ncbi:hypothetical protein MBLNU457_g0127t1 [Dothideomycetes sp. NU457]
MVALTTRLSGETSRAGKIISRDTSARDQRLPTYTISVGNKTISKISIEDILHYVSERELETYENEQFIEEGAEQDRIQRRLADEKAAKRRARLQKITARTYASSSAGSITGSSSAEEEFKKPALPTVEGRHGRPRPSYAHLYIQQQRGPNKTTNDEQLKRRGRPSKVMEDLPQAAAELSLAEDRPKRRKLSHTSSSASASRSEDEQQPVRTATSFRDLKARGQLSKSTVEVVIPGLKRAPSAAATASTSNDDDVVLVNHAVSASPDIKAITPAIASEQHAHVPTAVPQYKATQKATMTQSPSVRSPVLPVEDKTFTSKSQVPIVTSQAQQSPLPTSTPVKVKFIQPSSQPRLQPLVQSSTQSRLKVLQPKPQPPPQSQSPITSQTQTQDSSATGVQAQTSSQSRAQNLPQSKPQPQVKLQPKTAVQSQIRSQPQVKPQPKPNAWTLTQGKNKQVITIDTDSDSDDTDELQSRPAPPAPAPAPAPAAATSPSPSGDSSGSETWEIDEILSHRWSDPKSHPGKKPVMLYEVQWANGERTWEPLDSFDDPQTLRDYHGLVEARKLAKAKARAT